MHEHWSTNLVTDETIKPGELYSALDLARRNKVRVDTMRNHIKRNLRRLNLGDAPDKWNSDTGYWYGWKVQATVSHKFLTNEQRDRVEKQIKIAHAQVAEEKLRTEESEGEAVAITEEPKREAMATVVKEPFGLNLRWLVLGVFFAGALIAYAFLNQTDKQERRPALFLTPAKNLTIN